MTRWERVWGLSIREADWNGRSDASSPSLHARFRSCSSWVNSPVTSRQSCYLPSVHYLLGAGNNHLAVVCDAATFERESLWLRLKQEQPHATRRNRFYSGHIEAVRHRITLTSRTNQLYSWINNIIFSDSFILFFILFHLIHFKTKYYLIYTWLEIKYYFI